MNYIAGGVNEGAVAGDQLKRKKHKKDEDKSRGLNSPSKIS